MMPGTNFINGVPGDLLSVEDRGLAYGDGLFETIAIINGRPQLLNLHLHRLARSCVRLAIQLDLSLLKQEIDQIISHADTAAPHCLKIIITRQSSGRGYRYQQSEAVRILQLSTNAVSYAVIQSDGVRVRVCDTRLSINPQLSGMKHLCRLENVLARAEWHDDAIYEGLMLDAGDNVIEGVMSNVFVIKLGMLVTPHLDQCGVAGIIRALIINQLAPQIQLPVSVDRVKIEQLHDADEIFICNSLIGIVPVNGIGQFKKPVGVITVRLQEALHAYFEQAGQITIDD